MKEARISDLKNNLSRYLDLVRKGQVIRVLDGDRPVAEIVPIPVGAGARVVGPESLAQMERKGLIRRGTNKTDPDLLREDPPGEPTGVLAALLAERDRR